MAPDQTAAKRYLAILRSWLPAAQAEQVAQIATADTPGAHAVLAGFRLKPEPSILVTVAMAYEGLDAPEAVAALNPYLPAPLAGTDGGPGDAGRPERRAV